MISRRTFIVSGAAVGGGLVLGYGYLSLDDGDAAQKFADSGQSAFPLNAWVKITPEGRIICGIHRAEMGQGIATTIAMLLAEELDADWDQVGFEFVPVDRDYYNFGMLLNGQPLGDPAASWRAATGTWAIRQVFHALGMSMTIASSSTIDAWDTVRPAGATARQMLLGAAAEQWGVSPESLKTERGRVIDAANNRRLGYGELAELASRQQPPAVIELKDPATYTLVGHNPARLDGPAKATGQARFGMDVTLPDMLYAAVVHSPVAGTNVASFESNGADTMPGVRDIVIAGAPGFERAVAVIAESSWQALQAAERVVVSPVAIESEHVNSAELEDQYRHILDTTPAFYLRDDELIEAMLETNEVFSADYFVPFLAHACMEPMNCTALYSGDKLEIWAPSQANSVGRDVAAKLCGLDTSQVVVHTTFLGGGFGRRTEMDFIEQAVAVAMQVPGRPVKLFWSREQDIRHDAFRPAASCRMHAVTDPGGALLALDYKLVTQSVVASYETRTPTPRGGSAETDSSVVEAVNPPVYPVSYLRLGFVPADLHVPAGYWRSVAHSWTTFFMESFIDELAVAAGRDPLEYRQTALRDSPRHARVLATLRDAIGSRTGDGIGFAIAESHTTVVAHAIEVTANKGKFDRVTRVVCVVDCGPVIHPDNVIAQMEGSVVDGLSAALHGRVDFEDGQAVQGNFDTYRRMRMAECPPIEVHLVTSEQQRPGGVGEPGVPGVAPALTNAIFNATGTRMRSLPISSG